MSSLHSGTSQASMVMSLTNPVMRSEALQSHSFSMRINETQYKSYAQLLFSHLRLYQQQLQPHS